MALIKCPNCNKSISDVNSSCPFCSAPLAGKGSLPAPEDHQTEAFEQETEMNPVSGSVKENEASADIKGAQPAKAGKAEAKSLSPEHSDFYKKHYKPRPGRRLLGFRANNPLIMFLSIVYYMTSAVAILKFSSGFSAAAESGKTLFMLIRLICLLLICYLPVFLFTGRTPDHPTRKELSLLGITDVILLVLFVLCTFL